MQSRKIDIAPIHHIEGPRLLAKHAALMARFPNMQHDEATWCTSTPASVMSEGVVRKIDAANAKITLRHGPFVNLDMPPAGMGLGMGPGMDPGGGMGPGYRR